MYMIIGTVLAISVVGFIGFLVWCHHQAQENGGEEG